MRTKLDIYNAIINGDTYSNEEAIEIRNHFKLIADSCKELGNIFYLPFQEANQRYIELSKVCNTRKISTIETLENYYWFIVKCQQTDGTINNKYEILSSYEDILSKFYELPIELIKQTILDNTSFGSHFTAHEYLLKISEGSLRIKYLKWDSVCRPNTHLKKYISYVKNGKFSIVIKNIHQSIRLPQSFTQSLFISNDKLYRSKTNFDIRDFPSLTINEAIQYIKHN